MPSRTNNRTDVGGGRQSRRDFQPRVGERSEAEGGLASCVRLSLRAIPPPAPILPGEVGNLAYFVGPRRHTRVRLILRGGMSQRSDEGGVGGACTLLAFTLPDFR